MLSTSSSTQTTIRTKYLELKVEFDLGYVIDYIIYVVIQNRLFMHSFENDHVNARLSEWYILLF